MFLFKILIASLFRPLNQTEISLNPNIFALKPNSYHGKKYDRIKCCYNSAEQQGKKGKLFVAPISAMNTQSYI